MSDEFNEGTPHEATDATEGRHDVDNGEDGRQEKDGRRQHCFKCLGPTPEARQTLVPDRSEQLLAVGVCYKLHKCVSLLYPYPRFAMLVDLILYTLHLRATK